MKSDIIRYNDLYEGVILMPKYTVTFVKQESYDVEAENQCEAEDIALAMLNDDEYAFLSSPIHEIFIENIDEEKLYRKI